MHTYLALERVVVDAVIMDRATVELWKGLKKEELRKYW